MESLKKDLQELRKVCAGFQALVLPEGIPPTSSDVITRLNEHLLNVLSQLHGKEAELGRAQEALEKFQRKFAVIIHQQVCTCIFSTSEMYMNIHVICMHSKLCLIPSC